jgi:hypothetical protein
LKGKEVMLKSPAEKILNLSTAILVLVAGLYIIIFLPVSLSLPVRIVMGILLLLYFSWRINYYVRQTRSREKRES